MALILDTNALSAFVDGDERILGVLDDPDLALPVIVLGEYLYGVRASRLRSRYEQWLSANLGVFEMLPVEPETAEHYAEIRRALKVAGQPIPSNDVWIAAVAKQHGWPLVTRDAHFGAVPGLRLRSW